VTKFLVPFLLIFFCEKSHLSEKRRQPMGEAQWTRSREEVLQQSLLPESSRREGAKPYQKLVKNGVHPPERTIYRDPLTHKEVWRMTTDPAIERHIYYDIPAWNADGSLILFLSDRLGHKGYWLMDADGSNIRPLDPKRKPGIKTAYWSTKNPQWLYFMQKARKDTAICQLDLQSGGVKTLATVSGTGFRFAPPSADEAKFLLDKPEDKLVLLVDAKSGSAKKLSMEAVVHRLRFTRAQDYSIFYNGEARQGYPHHSWVMDRDGKNVRRISELDHRHPDWSPDGALLFFYAQRKMWTVDRQTAEHRVILDLGVGGHGGWSQDGKWFVSDSINRGRFPNQIFMVSADGSGEVKTLCLHNASYVGWSAGHPDAESTHPAPVSSPDDTKVIFDSDMSDVWGDIYVVVARRPDAPEKISVQRKDKQAIIRWERPERSKELAGYNIYRLVEAARMGRKEKERIVRLNDAPLKEERFLDSAPEETAEYAVTSVENCGLESALPDDFARLVKRPETLRGLEAEAQDAKEVKISWQKVSVPHFHHYNLYCSREPDFAPSREYLIASPTTNSFLDWGLKANTAYYYKVTALDKWGNESAASLAAVANTK
jgi:Tol biopolymer transport system component